MRSGVLAISILSACSHRPLAAGEVELVDDPEVVTTRRVVDSRSCFGDHLELLAGERATWRFREGETPRQLVVFSREAVDAPRFFLDGTALVVRRLRPGWTRIASVPAGHDAVLLLEGGARADAAALVPARASTQDVEAFTLAREMEALRESARTGWSVELSAQKAYPDNDVAGCSKVIPEDDVCPSWRLPGTAHEVLETLWAGHFAARGYVFEPRDWNAATTRCKARAGLDVSACLSCSTALPPFVAEQGLVPVGVYHPLWCSPAAGGQCGTCLKIRLPDGDPESPKCTPETSALLPHCPAKGTIRYRDLLDRKGSFDVRVRLDADGEYIVGYITEWFDNVAGPLEALPMSIDFATHTGEVNGVGNFPVTYELTECPVDDDELGYVVVDTREATKTRGRLPWLKLRVLDNARPLESVRVKLRGDWYDANQAADGHWEVMETLALDSPLVVRTAMFTPHGEPVIRDVALRANEALCRYQDPDCRALRR